MSHELPIDIGACDVNMVNPILFFHEMKIFVSHELPIDFAARDVSMSTPIFFT